MHLARERSKGESGSEARPLSLPSSRLPGPLPPRGVGRLDSPLDPDLHYPNANPLKLTPSSGRA